MADVNAYLKGEKKKTRSAGKAAEREQDRLRLEAQSRDDLVAQQSRLLQQKQQKIQSLRTEMDKLRQNESRLRTVILDKAGTEQVSDQEVIYKFTNLRRRIETIARLPTYCMD